MKKILFILSMLISTVTFAQFTTLNPDTVCVGTSGSIYNVTNTPGYVYTWTVASPGVLVSGQGTNQINVDWSAAGPGLITNAITVYATGPTGCQSTPVTLNVFILQIIPTITPIGPLCAGSPCVNLVGSPIGGTWSGTGVVGNQFCPTTSGVGTFTVTYTVTQGGCTFTTTTTITVDPIPVLSPIQHN
jgi:hypothetical protein